MVYQIKHPEGKEIPMHEGNKFDWSASKQKGIAEASDLPRPMAGYLFRDAYDIGFAVRSHKTNQVMVFTLNDEVRTPQGDEVIKWVFTSDTNPQITIEVIND